MVHLATPQPRWIHCIHRTTRGPHGPFADLDASTTGTVAAQGREEYDALISSWNLALPVRPAAVLRAATGER
jgi:hypothetical protein